MALRHIETQFDGSTKSYVTAERARKAATDLAEKLHGMVNVRIVATAHDADGQWGVRWTAIFSCFSEQSDLMAVAHAGFVCHA